MPVAVCSNSKTLRSSSLPKPNSVSESSPHHQRGRHAGELAGLQRRERVRRALHPQAHPSHVNDGSVRRDAGHGPFQVSDHAPPPVLGAVPRPRPRHRRPRDARPRERRPPQQGAVPPQVADRQRQGVGRVRRGGPLVQSQQPGHHCGHLDLVGAPVSGYGGLDLTRRVQRHGQPVARRAHDRHRPGLRRAHHGPHVVLAEYPLHRHRVRLVLGDPALDLDLDRQQPGRDVLVRPGADDAHGDQRRRPSGHPVDHPEPAPRESRVHAQYPGGLHSRRLHPRHRPITVNSLLTRPLLARSLLTRPRLPARRTPVRDQRTGWRPVCRAPTPCRRSDGAIAVLSACAPARSRRACRRCRRRPPTGTRHRRGCRPSPGRPGAACGRGHPRTALPGHGDRPSVPLA